MARVMARLMGRVVDHMWRVLAGLLRGAHVLLWLLAGGLVLALVGAMWLLVTPSGARFALAQVESRVAGFTVASVEGSVWGGLALHELRFTSPDGLALRVDDARLRLDASALWQARPLALALSVQGATLRLPPRRPTTEASAPPLNLAALPIRVPLPLVLTAHIQAATVTDAADHILAQVPHAVLHAHATARQIRLALMPPSEVTLPTAAVSVFASGELALGVAEPHTVSGQWQWRVDAPEGWLPGTLHLSGSLHTLRAQLDASLLGDWLHPSLAGGLPPVSARAALVLPLSAHPGRIELPVLAVNFLDGCLTGSAEFDAGSDPATPASAHGQAVWQGINPGAVIPALAGQLAGAVHAQWQAAQGGRLEFSGLSGRVAGVALNDVAVTGQWDAQRAQLAITQGTVAQGALTAEATLGWDDRHPLSARLDWSGADWSSALQAQGMHAVAKGDTQLRITGALGDFSPAEAALRVDFVLEHGEIGLPNARLPAQATLRGAWQRGVLVLDAAEARWGVARDAARMDAQGRMGFGAAAQTTDSLHASLTVPQGARLPLAAFGLPALAGSLTAQVAVQGNHRNPPTPLSGESSQYARPLEGGHRNPPTPLSGGTSQSPRPHEWGSSQYAHPFEGRHPNTPAPLSGGTSQSPRPHEWGSSQYAHPLEGGQPNTPSPLRGEGWGGGAGIRGDAGVRGGGNEHDPAIGTPSHPPTPTQGAEAHPQGIAPSEWSQLTGTARLDGRGLAVAGWRLGFLTVSASLNAQQQGELRLQAKAISQQGREQIKDLTLDLTGAVPGLAASGCQRLTAQVQSAMGALSLAADGRWQAPQWQGQLTALNVRPLRWHEHTLPDWQLQRAVPVSISATAQTLGTISPNGQSSGALCLVSQADARLCVAGQYAPAQGGSGQTRSGGSGNGRAQLSANLPLALAQPWLPAGLSLPGRLVVDGSAELRAGLPTAAVSLELPASSLRWPTVLGAASVAYEPVRGTARWQNQQVSAQLKTDTPGLLRLNGQGQWTMTGAEPISAQLALAVPRLERFGFLLPMLSGLAGQAEADLTVGGTRTAPRLTGTAALKDLAFALPDTGISYRDGGLAARIDPQGGLQFSGEITAVAPRTPGDAAESQAAALHLNGSGQLADFRQWQAQAQLNGEGVPTLRLPMLSVDASPSLSVVADAAGATVTGQIVLPRVDARVAALPAGVVVPTEDLVIEGRHPPSPKPAAYPVQGKIALRLGDAVHLSGMGFRSDLAGGLTLSLTPNQPISALGEVRLVNGRYSAYGQDLHINPGRLVFVGPLTDPGLAVRAERRVDSSTVGLNIAGTLLHPKTTVFSNPSLPESEALSLLITGRSLDSASMSDGSAIKNAAVGLGIAQGDNVLRDLGERFGFSGLGLDTTGGLDGTRLSLGRQINDRLFVRYAVGVFTGVGELITRYRLNRLFSIELTTSPEASGGDLIYQLK